VLEQPSYAKMSEDGKRQLYFRPNCSLSSRKSAGEGVSK
jgi:hypothetical protein